MESSHTSRTTFQSGSTYIRQRQNSYFFIVFSCIFVFYNFWNLLLCTIEQRAENRDRRLEPQENEVTFNLRNIFSPKIPSPLACAQTKHTDTNCFLSFTPNDTKRFKTTLDELHGENICHFYVFALKRILLWYVMLSLVLSLSLTSLALCTTGCKYTYLWIMLNSRM